VILGDLGDPWYNTFIGISLNYGVSELFEAIEN
jgi:hypothetical protein